MNRVYILYIYIVVPWGVAQILRVQTTCSCMIFITGVVCPIDLHPLGYVQNSIWLGREHACALWTVSGSSK